MAAKEEYTEEEIREAKFNKKSKADFKEELRKTLGYSKEKAEELDEIRRDKQGT